jgi:hypothetical protein
MKKVKVTLHQPLNIFTLVKSLLTITILEEVVAQYEVIDIYPSLERTHTLEKLIKANKDNVYASDVKLDCFYECTELEDRELLARDFSTKSHDLTIN